jgi:uncharacterized protein YraI
MRKTVLYALATGLMIATLTGMPAAAGWRDRYEVFGVQGEDMLKMRAGPGTGFVVIVGLPNGALVRVESCQQIGGTRWCKVFLDRVHALKGYVSGAYLRAK